MKENRPQSLSRHGSLVSAQALAMFTAVNTLARAQGTPLAWPEAKQNAHRVREWGIEVGTVLWAFPNIPSSFIFSNYLLYGTVQKAKSGMHCFGETR